MTAHLVNDHADVVHTTEQHSGKVHTNNGHPIVGTLPEAFGTLVTTEAADIVAVTGLAGAIGSLVATEALDAAAFVGTVTAAGITGTLAATEAIDVAAGNGLAGLVGTLVASEAADTFAGAGIVASADERIGVLAATEAADTAAAIGVVAGDILVSIPGGRYMPPWPTVEGDGYGILPPLQGEAFGVVVAAAIGQRQLPCFAAAATGSIGAVGNSQVRFALKAMAAGDCGQAGAAGAELNSLVAAGLGRSSVRGKGFGMITKCEGAAIGQHTDDDEAAAVIVLLAA